MLAICALLTALNVTAAPPRDTAAASFHSGVNQLQLQNFAAAIRHLERARRLARSAELVRSIELELGEAQRRSGHYQIAMRLFQNVAKGEDEVAAQAHARAGQMAIEWRHYEEARALLQAQLWANPTGEERDAALWGLGWVAFRTGDFGTAKNDFATLRQESPKGTYTAAATYWYARALAEAGDDDASRRILSELANAWPTDYYGYRAEQLLDAASRSMLAPVKVEPVRQPPGQNGFMTLIKAAATANQLDPDLLTALIHQESRFNPRARSPVGALGLMQLMPATGRSLWREEKRHKTAFNLYDPEINVRLGTRLLARLVRSFSHQDEYALATYNAGTTAVMRWRTRQGELPTDIFVEEIPYSETRAYVKKVLARRQLAKQTR